MPLPLDAVIIGGGHNGLVCAGYLAGAGLRVRVLERRAIVGGAAVTEEFHPGYRNSTASYTVSLLHSKIIAELNLAHHGLRILERPMGNFLPLPEGNHLVLHGNLRANQAEFARFSHKDAARLPDYYGMLERAARLLRALALQTPPNAGGGLIDALRGLRAANQLRRLALAEQRDLLALFTRSAGDLLDQWFDTDAIKGAFGFDSVVGNFASPYTAGSAYVLLHHVFGEVNGRSGAWGHAVGGMGAITQAMAAEARRRGAQISTRTEVVGVNVRAGRADGVMLADGSQLKAHCVIANVNPKRLYLDLLDPGALDEDFVRRIRAYRCGSATLRINLALDKLPQFSCLPLGRVTDHHRSGIIMCPSLSYMERAYFDARFNGWSREPVVEMLIPSTVDDTLARPGGHVASLFCQHFNPCLPDGGSWDEAREPATDSALRIVESYAPGFIDSIIARKVLSPLDLEREFGLIGGDIFHGALGLDQLYSARPLLGHGNYRGPLVGLYMCGAGTHPGGGVSGLPGHNAAREILSDLRGRRCLPQRSRRKRLSSESLDMT
jgi:phytoene dehydrogenase-like protein